MAQATEIERRIIDSAIEQLTLKHGRVRVKEGYADGNVRVTAPNTAHFHITPQGAVIPKGNDVSNFRDWA